MTPDQISDYQRLRSYFPYRLFFLVKESADSLPEIWAQKDRRAVNKVLRNGGEVSQILND